jgi:DNA invertase Pin-like site-specific DNA recombinase
MAKKESGKAIAYYRVSTQRQGQSGLGLEGQRASVEQYAKANNLSIIEDYTEVETGTNKRNRVEIEKAIASAKRNRATLLIAKLDRLSRSVSFTAALMDSGAKFVAVDMPQANDLTIHILAAVAQAEAKAISERTKAALAAAKARGVVLGNPANLTNEARQKGRESQRHDARQDYHQITGYVKLLRKQGDPATSYDKIAKRLNAEGHRTRQGKPFQAMTVYRIVQRNGSE